MCQSAELIRDSAGWQMTEAIRTWLESENKTVAFVLFCGVVAFVAKGAYELWAARRKDRLERVNQQLKLLYGPLYALNEASEVAWKEFRRKTRPGMRFFKDLPKPNDEELKAWRRWMLTVIKPIHDAMFSTITKNADLLLSDDLPVPFKDFCAHVTAYRVVFDQWSKNDFSEHTTGLRYPKAALTPYLLESFKELKDNQGRLLAARPFKLPWSQSKTRRHQLGSKQPGAHDGIPT
jgi:hypothetical protein